MAEPRGKENWVGDLGQRTPLPERVTHERIIEAPETRAVLDRRMIGNFPAGNTTPTVLNVEYWRARNTGAVTITDFLKGQEGQHLYIIGDGQTTLQDNADIVIFAGGDLLLSDGLVYHFIRMKDSADVLAWRQV